MKIKTLKKYLKEHSNLSVKEIALIEKKERLIKELKNNDSVEFMHNGYFHVIDYSCDNEGYMVDIYLSEDDYKRECFDSEDGGLCTGSERDAIEFMINWGV